MRLFPMAQLDRPRRRSRRALLGGLLLALLAGQALTPTFNSTGAATAAPAAGLSAAPDTGHARQYIEASLARLSVPAHEFLPSFRYGHPGIHPPGPAAPAAPVALGSTPQKLLDALAGPQPAAAPRETGPAPLDPAGSLPQSGGPVAPSPFSFPGDGGGFLGTGGGQPPNPPSTPAPPVTPPVSPPTTPPVTPPVVTPPVVTPPVITPPVTPPGPPTVTPIVDPPPVVPPVVTPPIIPPITPPDAPPTAPPGGLPIAGVPEPITWAMLILGVFALGAALRSRRAAAARALIALRHSEQA